MQALSRRIAAVAEVLLILAAGNLLGQFLFLTLAPADVIERQAAPVVVATWDGLLILLRLGSAGALGYVLLYLRAGITPRHAGLTRNNYSLASLLGRGLLLGLFSSFLVSAFFTLNDYMPLGEGIPGWQTAGESTIDLAFWVSVLATSVLIPPVTEEIMTRGYMRVRLVEDYGSIAGVMMTGLVFGLSHTRYLGADGMLLGFMLVVLINSIAWTYMAQRTGSIVSPLIAHAMSNGIGMAVLFNPLPPFLACSVLLVVFHKPVLQVIRAFLSEFREQTDFRALWQGLAILASILVFALASLSLFGRIATLAGLGVVCLLVTCYGFVKLRPVNEAGQYRGDPPASASQPGSEAAQNRLESSSIVAASSSSGPDG